MPPRRWRWLGGIPSPSTADAAIRAAVLLAVLVPLYFNPLTHHSFEPDKAALLRAIVLLALAVWAILAIDRYLRGRTVLASTADNGRHAGRRLVDILTAPLVIPVLLLAAAYLAATVGSVLPRLSLNGTHTRAQGLYTLGAYFALFFLVRRIRWTDRQVTVLANTLVLASIPIAVYAILQRFGLDLLSFTTEGTPVTVRPISTLGNPIFLAAYLVMVLPLTGWRFYLSWTRRNTWALGAWGLILLLQATAFVLAESRGPLLGLIAALAFAALIGMARARARRPLVGAAILVVVMAAITQVIPASDVAPSQWGRLGEAADLSSRTARQRILTWQAATDLIAAERTRLWFGHGPATFREVVTPYMPPEMAQLKPDLDFDRAHNAVLDTWVSAGLVAVAAYLLATGGILFYGLRLLGFAHSDFRRRLLLGFMLVGTLLGGLVAWLWPGRHWIGVGLPVGLIAGAAVFLVTETLAQNHTVTSSRWATPLTIPLLIGIVAHTVETMAGMATVATSILFWLYAGIVASQAARGDEVSPDAGDPFPAHAWGMITGSAVALVSFPLLSHSYAPSPSSGLLMMGALASITTMFGIWSLTIEHRVASGGVAPYLGTAAATVAGFLLLEWLPWPPTDLSHTSVAVFAFVILAVPTLAAMGRSDDKPTTSVAAGMPQGQGLAARQLMYGLILLVTLVAIWITSVTPIRADVFYKEGLARTTAGDVLAARALLERSVNLAPDQDVYQSQLGVIFAQLAVRAAEFAAGDDAAQRQEWLTRAEDHLKHAQQLDPYRSDHLRNLGVLHHQVWAKSARNEAESEHIDLALSYYAEAAERNPISVRVYRDWGQAHAILGEWSAAIERYEASLRLNADFLETWILLGDAKLRIGDYNGAKEAYQRALALDEEHVRATYEAAAAASADDPLPHQALALIYAGMGHTQGALAQADTARALTPGESVNWEAFLALLQ